MEADMRGWMGRENVQWRNAAEVRENPVGMVSVLFHSYVY